MLLKRGLMYILSFSFFLFYPFTGWPHSYQMLWCNKSREVNLLCVKGPQPDESLRYAIHSSLIVPMILSSSFNPIWFTIPCVDGFLNMKQRIITLYITYNNVYCTLINNIAFHIILCVKFYFLHLNHSNFTEIARNQYMIEWL